MQWPTSAFPPPLRAAHGQKECNNRRDITIPNNPMRLITLLTVSLAVTFTACSSDTVPESSVSESGPTVVQCGLAWQANEWLEKLDLQFD